jgi:hypothetical protein
LEEEAEDDIRNVVDAGTGYMLHSSIDPTSEGAKEKIDKRINGTLQQAAMALRLEGAGTEGNSKPMSYYEDRVRETLRGAALRGEFPYAPDIELYREQDGEKTNLRIKTVADTLLLPYESKSWEISNDI